MPEPTADGEFTPAAMEEPVRRTAQTIASEPEPQCESVQVCEPATTVPVGVLVELDTEDWLIDWETEVVLTTQPRPVSPVSSSPALSLFHCPVLSLLLL